jgi:hypothetical protein
MVAQSRKSRDPFAFWSAGLALERTGKLADSERQFKAGAEAFYIKASENTAISKALNEYSTLLDAFANTQRARIFSSRSRFSQSVQAFSRGSEIFRSTIHFGFLAAYVSACATLETARAFGKKSKDLFQAYRNAIALFEQSKLALSFRDQSHPLMREIQGLILFTISKALKFEAMEAHNRKLANDKESRSKQLLAESETLLRRDASEIGSLEYFPSNDWFRAGTGSFLMAYPDAENLWLSNLGINPATVEKLGNLRPETTVQPKSSISFPLKSLAKGKIRVVYADLTTHTKYDEGCISLI